MPTPARRAIALPFRYEWRNWVDPGESWQGCQGGAASPESDCPWLRVCRTTRKHYVQPGATSLRRLHFSLMPLGQPLSWSNLSPLELMLSPIENLISNLVNIICHCGNVIVILCLLNNKFTNFEKRDFMDSSAKRPYINFPDGLHSLTHVTPSHALYFQVVITPTLARHEPNDRYPGASLRSRPSQIHPQPRNSNGAIVQPPQVDIAAPQHHLRAVKSGGDDGGVFAAGAAG